MSSVSTPQDKAMKASARRGPKTLAEDAAGNLQQRVAEIEAAEDPADLVVA